MEDETGEKSDPSKTPWETYLAPHKLPLQAPYEVMSHETIPRFTSDHLITSYLDKPLELRNMLEAFSLRELHGEIKIHQAKPTVWVDYVKGVRNIPTFFTTHLWSREYWQQWKQDTFDFDLYVDQIDDQKSCLGLWFSFEFQLGMEPPPVLGPPPPPSSSSSSHADFKAWDQHYYKQFQQFMHWAQTYDDKGDAYLRYECACWHRALLCVRILFLRKELSMFDTSDILKCSRRYIALRCKMRYPYRLAPDFYYQPSAEQHLLEDERNNHVRPVSEGRPGIKPMCHKHGKTHTIESVKPISLSQLSKARKETGNPREIYKQ